MKQQTDTLVIIPVFNEGRNIGLVIDELVKKCNNVDILVINDGSTDKTEKIAKNKGVFVISHVFNIGVGASFETGCQFALKENYSFIVRMDGDGQHDASFIKDILAPLKKAEIDIAIGSRFIGKSQFKSSRPRLIGIWIISAFLFILTRKKITDPTSGFCAMNRRAFEFFSKNCAEDYPEPEILVFHRNFKMKEVPISIARRLEGISSITPLRSVYYMIKVLLSLLVHIFRKEIK